MRRLDQTSHRQDLGGQGGLRAVRRRAGQVQLLAADGHGAAARAHCAGGAGGGPARGAGRVPGWEARDVAAQRRVPQVGAACSRQHRIQGFARIPNVRSAFQQGPRQRARTKAGGAPSEGAPPPNTGISSGASASLAGGIGVSGSAAKRKLASEARGAGLASLLCRRKEVLRVEGRQRNANQQAMEPLLPVLPVPSQLSHGANCRLSGLLPRSTAFGALLEESSSCLTSYTDFLYCQLAKLKRCIG